MQTLASKAAVVAGGSSGIGLATAKLFVESGANRVNSGFGKRVGIERNLVGFQWSGPDLPARKHRSIWTAVENRSDVNDLSFFT